MLTYAGCFLNSFLQSGKAQEGLLWCLVAVQLVQQPSGVLAASHTISVACADMHMPQQDTADRLSCAHVWTTILPS